MKRKYQLITSFINPAPHVYNYDDNYAPCFIFPSIWLRKSNATFDIGISWFKRTMFLAWIDWDEIKANEARMIEHQNRAYMAKLKGRKLKNKKH